jgi:hypothetical protein
MNEETIIELWVKANKLAGVVHTPNYNELKEFANLIEQRVLQEFKWLSMGEVLGIADTVKGPISFYTAIEIKLKEKNQ